MINENTGIKIGAVKSVSTIIKRAGKAIPGMGLPAFAFLLVCLAAVGGYLLGTQVSLPEEQQTVYTESKLPLSSPEQQLKLKSVKEAENPETIEMKFEEMQPAASSDPEERAIMTKVKEEEQQASFVHESEPSVEANVKKARYTLAGGAYIIYDNLQKDRQFAEMLGLPFLVEEKKKSVKMTRLFVGTFPIEIGKAKLERAKTYTPDAFAIRHGRKVSIYAGSFYYPSDAHRWKNRLMDQGLNVKEVSAQVEMPLYAAYIGDFDTVEEAMLAGLNAERAGRKMPIIGIR